MRFLRASLLCLLALVPCARAVVLDAATDKLQIVLLANVTTTALPYYVDYADQDSTTTLAVSSSNGTTNNTTAVDVAASPVAGQWRTVNRLMINNVDTASATLTVRFNDNGTTRTLCTVLLQVGDALRFSPGQGFYVTDAAGTIKTATAGAGRYLRTVVLTSGTSHTTSAGCATIRVRVQAAGGAGGGCTSLAAACGAGGGGAAGGYAEKTFTVTANTAYAYTIGAAGTGVSAATGNAGGNSTFTVGGTTVTAFGGPGGLVGTAAITLTARAGGASPATSTNGDVNIGGDPGEDGICLLVATPIVASGAGGSSTFGAGGVGLVVVGAGNIGIGFGSGGGGAATGASTVRTGGNGTGGVIVVEEFT